MTAGNGKACVRCGTSEWNVGGGCKECQREHNRRWQSAHPEQYRESIRRWGASHPDRVVAKARRYNQANKQKKAEYDRRYQETNPDKVAAAKHRHRTRKSEAGGSYTSTEWKALCEHYGNRCLKCGRTDVKLTADHILPVSRGGSSNIENMQPLCGSCNSAKGDKNLDYRPDAGIARWIQAKLFG